MTRRRDLAVLERLVSINDAATMLAVNPRTVRRLADDGELPCVYVGRRRLFALDAIDDFIDAHTTTTTARRSA